MGLQTLGVVGRTARPAVITPIGAKENVTLEIGGTHRAIIVGRTRPV